MVQQKTTILIKYDSKNIFMYFTFVHFHIQFSWLNSRVHTRVHRYEHQRENVCGVNFHGNVILAVTM